MIKKFIKKSFLNKFIGALNSKRIYKGNYPTDQYEIDFSDYEITDLLDELSFLLTSIGLDKDDEVNEKGMLIENIIDKFYQI